MEEKEIYSITQLLDEPLWNARTMLFRGVSDSKYPLVPSVGRLDIKKESSLEQFEKDSLKEFKRRSLPFLKFIPETQLEWLFLAQHYGLPTRLLDWTLNPLVAIYFACSSNKDSEFAVYRYIHTKWIEHQYTGDPFSLDQIFGLRPPHHDTRYVNQDCAFTIHPNPTSPLEHESITKYIFPRESRETIKWQVYKFGLKSSHIYPGLDGVAKDVLRELDTQLNNGMVRTTGTLFSSTR